MRLQLTLGLHRAKTLNETVINQSLQRCRQSASAILAVVTLMMVCLHDMEMARATKAMRSSNTSAASCVESLEISFEAFKPQKGAQTCWFIFSHSSSRRASEKEARSK